MDKKTIIIIYGRANEGKTSTLLKLYRLLTNLIETKDISLIIEYRDLNIGFVTSSDPHGENLILFEENLQIVKNKNCDFIFCTSRTQGESVRIIERNFESYHTMWISSVLSPTLNIDLVNENHAIYLKNTLNKLIDNSNFYNS